MAEKKIKTPEELRAEGIGMAGTAAAANSITGTSVNKTEMVDNPNKLNLAAATDSASANSNLTSMANALNNYTATKPGAYQDGFQDKLSNLYEQIQNGGKFNFDLNSDALYNQYKDMYTKQGGLASEDVAGQVSALTGGYGNSYAATASNQAYQQYLNQLNDRALDIYDRRYNEFQNSRNDLYNQYNLLNSERVFDYNRYRDDVSDYYTEGDRLYNLYNNAQNAAGDWRDYEYGVERDKVADDQWREQFDYGKEQDALAYQQWREQFDYGKQQDAIANQLARDQLEWNKQSAGYENTIAALESNNSNLQSQIDEQKNAADNLNTVKQKIRQINGTDTTSMYNKALDIALDVGEVMNFNTFRSVYGSNASPDVYALYLQNTVATQWGTTR